MWAATVRIDQENRLFDVVQFLSRLEVQFLHEFIVELCGINQIFIADFLEEINDLFIDDVEFYIDDDLSPVSIENQYEVYGVGSEVKLTFNLTQKETVFLKIYNMLGQPVLEDQLHDVLNQTYTFDIHQQGTGIYIIWVQFANQVGSSKVFLTGSNWS